MPFFPLIRRQSKGEPLKTPMAQPSLATASEWDKTLALLREVASLLCAVDMDALERPSHWTADADVSACQACAAPFTILNRRHHCRCCGGVLCGACSTGRVALPNWGHPAPERVCADCEAFERSMLSMLLAGDPFTLPVRQSSMGGMLHETRYVALSADLSSLTVTPVSNPPTPRAGVLPLRAASAPSVHDGWSDSDTASTPSSASTSSLTGFDDQLGGEASPVGVHAAPLSGATASLGSFGVGAAPSAAALYAEHVGAIPLACVVEVQSAPPPICGLSLKVATPTGGVPPTAADAPAPAGVGGRILLQHEDPRVVAQWAAALERLVQIRARRGRAVRTRHAGGHARVGGAPAHAGAGGIAPMRRVGVANPAFAAPSTGGSGQLRSYTERRANTLRDARKSELLRQRTPMAAAPAAAPVRSGPDAAAAAWAAPGSVAHGGSGQRSPSRELRVVRAGQAAARPPSAGPQPRKPRLVHPWGGKLQLAKPPPKPPPRAPPRPAGSRTAVMAPF